MKVKTVDELDLENKKVFVRIDIDCGSLENKKILDFKLENCLPTIKYLISENAKVIIGAHIGNSNNKKYSLEEVGLNLSTLLEKDIVFLDNIFNDSFKKLVVDLPAGSVILLENLVFSSSELNNSEDFPQFISNHIDYYVNEAFSLSDSNFASLNSSLDVLDKEKIAIGLNFKNEYENLRNIKNGLQKPLIIVLNGKEVTKKIEFANKFIEDVDKIVLIADVANSYSKAVGSDFSGNYDKDSLYMVKKLISSAKTRSIEIIKAGAINSSDKFEIPSNDVEYLIKVFSDAKSILWFGPVEGIGDLGPAFVGLEAFVSSIGDEACFSLEGSEYKHLFNYISTSGEAAQDYLKDNDLIVLEKLEEL